MPERADAFGDSDWAGDVVPRKSKTCVMGVIGRTLIDSYGEGQHVIALSSGESELYSIGSAAVGGLETVRIIAEYGVKLELRVHTDSTAARGMRHRLGSGKTRHRRDSVALGAREDEER